MNLKAIKHLYGSKILAFYSEQFGASGTAKNFAEGRIGLDGGDESSHSSQRLSDRCHGMDRDGLHGLPGSEAKVGEPCQTTGIVWLGIHAPPRATVTAGQGTGTGIFSIWA